MKQYQLFLCFLTLTVVVGLWAQNISTCSSKEQQPVTILIQGNRVHPDLDE